MDDTDVVVRGTSLRTAMDNAARLISMRTGWLVMAPSNALHPAPCVTSTSTSSSSSSSACSSCFSFFVVKGVGAVFLVAEVVRSVNVKPGNIF